MKFFPTALIILFCMIDVAHAQNTGIGTLTPKPSAILDVSSTTKGLLIPTMTSFQRVGISNPAEGLLVYDSSLARLYQYQDGVWRFLITNDYWMHSGTRDVVYNSTDSIGIGTTLPQERLDVNGNIRSRTDVIADEDVRAEGTISGSGLLSTGNMVIAGTSLLNGAVSTNSDININNTGATLQLKSSSVNKGFFQLNGDNVRTGTNSGNAGDYIIRMNGSDRVKVDQNGNIDLDGKITRTAVTGNAPLLPTAYGLVASDGTILRGTGNFTITRLQTGVYNITGANFGTITNYPVLILTPYYRSNIISGGIISTNTIQIVVRDADVNVEEDAAFYFVVYGQ